MPAEYSSFSLFPVFVWLQMQEILFISFGLDGAMEPNNWTVLSIEAICYVITCCCYIYVCYVYTYRMISRFSNSKQISNKNAKREDEKSVPPSENGENGRSMYIEL